MFRANVRIHDVVHVHVRHNDVCVQISATVGNCQICLCIHYLSMSLVGTSFWLTVACDVTMHSGRTLDVWKSLSFHVLASSIVQLLCVFVLCLSCVWTSLFSGYLTEISTCSSIIIAKLWFSQLYHVVFIEFVVGFSGHAHSIAPTSTRALWTCISARALYSIVFWLLVVSD